MNPQLYNSRIIDIYLRLIKARYKSVDIGILLKSAGIKAYEVADQGHWFTQDQVDRFHEKIVQLTGNERISREAGRYAASPETLGAMRQYVFGLFGPTRTFELINKSALKLTRSATYESRNISPHSVEIIVTPHEGVSEKPFQCENRIGFSEALVLAVGHQHPHIEHPECIFKGATSCRYIITWKNSRAGALRRRGLEATLLFVMVSLVLSFMGQWGVVQNLLHLFVPAILLLVAIIVTMEKNELKVSLDNISETTDKLIEQIDSNFNNSLMINEVGQVLNNCTHRFEILELVINIIKNRLSYDRGMIFLVNSERNELIQQTNFGYYPEHCNLLDTLSLRLDLTESKWNGAFFQDQKPFLVNDMNETEVNLFSPQLVEFYKKTGTKSFICCPIVSEGKPLGLLSVDNLTMNKMLVSSDVSLLMGIASVIGVSLRNIELIEEKVRHEKDLLKIEKLESIGVLAGGIAHDFNNLLTIFMGNVSLAQMFLDVSHDAYEPLLEAEKAATRARDISCQLLTFARGGEPVKKVVSLELIVYETVSLVLHGANVKANIEIPDSINAIEADEGQMSQVFHNIIINATQAMSDGGTLKIAAKNVTLSSQNTLSLPDGMYVNLSFSDQGCGISEDNLKKIFDPYFTTKSAGNGLGLASVFSIIKKHGGHIGVTSAVGKGTTFSIHLPSIGETFEKYQTQSLTQAATTHTGGSILVMDDEEKIRNMLTEILKCLGCQVTTCESGLEAIAVYNTARTSGTPFSAVIMDLTIPGGMGGKEAAQQILAIDPKACLIVSSGYSNDKVMSDFRSYGFAGAVAKPYKIKEVGQLISNVLSAR